MPHGGKRSEGFGGFEGSSEKEGSVQAKMGEIDRIVIRTVLYGYKARSRRRIEALKI